jgi:dihydrofolate synthase/folylpolyglutamate synthase
VITNIGLDHTQFLGNTIALIAFEKAGIIKHNVPVVIGEYISQSKPVFLAKAKENESEIYFAADLISKNHPSDLIGDYQMQNKKTVVQTITVLNQQNKFKISQKNISSGLLNIVENTGFKGRWQQIGNAPKVICDTAHNKHGLEIVLNQIEKEVFETLHIVIGVVNDKDLAEILPLFPKKAIYYFCKPNIIRGLDATILQQKAMSYELYGEVYNSVSEAYNFAVTNASKTDFIYVGGSTFVVAEIL